MGYASGVLLILIILFTLKKFHVRINFFRCIASGFVYLILFIILKFSKTHQIGLDEISVLTVFGLGLLCTLFFQDRLNIISSSIGVKRILVLAAAVLIHHESKSRGYEDNPQKQARFNLEKENLLAKWGRRISVDPWYNPNLSQEKIDYSLASVPRV
jgi:hypothetical protein